MDLPPEAVRRAIETYRGLPHRVEWVRAWRGVDFYDDSKATNVGAVVKALEGFDRPVLLLMGGRDKLGPYAPLLEGLEARGKGLFVFGEATPRIMEELGTALPAHSFPRSRSGLPGGGGTGGAPETWCCSLRPVPLSISMPATVSAGTISRASPPDWRNSTLHHGLCGRSGR